MNGRVRKGGEFAQEAGKGFNDREINAEVGGRVRFVVTIQPVEIEGNGEEWKVW
jgi:hypothetical protein